MTPRIEIDRHVEAMRRDGFTIVPDAIEPPLVEELRRELLRIERDRGIGYGQNDFEGRRTVRIYNLLAHGRIFERVPVHASVLPIAEALLGKGLLLSSLSAIGIDPGEKGQPIHADDQLIPLPRPHVPIAVNAMWALTDFTAANGATRVLPGSHLWESSPTYGSEHPSEIAEMRVGSVLLFNASLWHGGGPNRADTRRVGLACYYCAGWIRQQENQQLGLPVELVAGFAPELQELCGYGVYKGLYGHIEGRSPLETLLGRKPDRGMVWDAPVRRETAAV